MMHQGCLALTVTQGSQGVCCSIFLKASFPVDRYNCSFSVAEKLDYLTNACLAQVKNLHKCNKGCKMLRKIGHALMINEADVDEVQMKKMKVYLESSCVRYPNGKVLTLMDCLLSCNIPH